MAAETLYTAVHWYFRQLLDAAVAEAKFTAAAATRMPEVWNVDKLRDVERRVKLIEMLLVNIPEGFDDVPLPDGWRGLATIRKRMRVSDVHKKAMAKRTARKLRGDGQ